MTNHFSCSLMDPALQ